MNRMNRTKTNYNKQVLLSFILFVLFILSNMERLDSANDIGPSCRHAAHPEGALRRDRGAQPPPASRGRARAPPLRAARLAALPRLDGRRVGARRVGGPHEGRR